MKAIIKKPLLFFIAFCMWLGNIYSQTDKNLFSRTGAIKIDGISFFNVEGIEISSHTITGDFSKKNIQKWFKQTGIKKNDLNQSDSSIGDKNYFVKKEFSLLPDVKQSNSYYFIETPGLGINAIIFASTNEISKQFEHKWIKLIREKRIPDSLYEDQKIDSIKFVGRKVALGPTCSWMHVNNIQCSGNGQINWSVHQSFDGALKATQDQYKLIDAKKNGKIVKEDLVDVIFEGTETTAKRVLYDFKGVTSIMAGMSGGKNLTIYFVTTLVRDNYVSCVMSFWNNDRILPNGLAPLLSEVMQLKTN